MPPLYSFMACSQHLFLVLLGFEKLNLIIFGFLFKLWKSRQSSRTYSFMVYPPPFLLLIVIKILKIDPNHHWGDVPSTVTTIHLCSSSCPFSFFVICNYYILDICFFNIHYFLFWIFFISKLYSYLIFTLYLSNLILYFTWTLLSSLLILFILRNCVANIYTKLYIFYTWFSLNFVFFKEPR